MNEEKYIVAPNRSISTKVGIKKPKDRITQKECGSNWNILIKKGWIIKEKELYYKNDVAKEEVQLAKP